MFNSFYCFLLVKKLHTFFHNGIIIFSVKQCFCAEHTIKRTNRTFIHYLKVKQRKLIPKRWQKNSQIIFLFCQFQQTKYNLSIFCTFLVKYDILFNIGRLCIKFKLQRKGYFQFIVRWKSKKKQNSCSIWTKC